MHEKSFAKITVTDIITRAGVVRASYYRNYDSKEDVLTALVADVLEDFKNAADYDLTDYSSYKNVRCAFLYFKEYQDYILDLYHSGFSSTFWESLNHFHEINAGTMSIHSIERCELYIFIGALVNTGIIWLENGAEEDVDDIAVTFCRFMGIGK